MRQAPLDADGSPLGTGDRVRVLSVPDLSGMGEAEMRETTAVFRHLRGRETRLVAFNERGWAQLDFRIRGGPHQGLHSVWIETGLLRRVEPRPGGVAGASRRTPE